mmetsp:Transcript_5001/g.8125  ORF Transcript_5001/g.8125 Transcript_5001/m.8125 type:complete len:890 (+) Transcript_5001:53-2722(+)
MIAAKISLLVACCIFHAALSATLRKPPAALTSVKKAIAVSVADMKEVFVRSEQAHDDSIARMSADMTEAQAFEALQNSSYFGNSSELKEVTSLIGGEQLKRALRSGSKQPGQAGSGGIASAKKLLNEMIYEAMAKYDQEIAKCTSYYSKQCVLMEACRSSIAASNFVAANSRALILDAQANINKCEKSIPELKLELKTHNSKCAADLQKMNEHLKVVMGDIAVMTMILKMTDCETQFVQMEKMAMLRCRNNCTKTSYVVFNQTKLQKQVSSLQSSAAKVLLGDSFADMFDDAGPEVTIDFAQVDGSFFQQVATTTPSPLAEPNLTKFNNPPIPRTQVPGNPCNDPNAGAPSAADKRAAKCTIEKSPQCYKLQSRFLMIQGGIQDEADQLKDDIAQLESFCDETSKTLETTIANDQSMLASQQTKLAAATEKEANAGEEARQTSKQNEQLNADLRKQMKKCSDNYIQFETELCALKKIRGELYKMKGDGHTGFFQDCEVAKWDPEECTKKCAGGEQKLSRAVLTHPNGGSKCLPLTAIRSCNNGPCPVDCVLLQWTGWSKCSADCGGGVTQRLRDVKKAMRYGGKPCSSTSETKACNAAACEKDCELSDWTEWTVCSKDCDGGSRKRSKFVQHPAEGSGKCAGQWDVSRLEYKSCNMHRCKVNDVTKALPCNRSMDVILLIDACPKSGEEGYAAEMKAANLIVDAFNPQKTNIAIVQYCGPRTWSGVSVCTGKSTGAIDTEKVCKVKLAQHFSTDIAKTKAVLNGLEYMKGEKLLEMALLSAEAELALGNKDAHATVIAFLDGSPLSPRKTRMAAEKIRKKARLLWITVTKFSPLKNIKLWSTRRWQENIVKVTDTTQLAQAATATHVIANICPDEFPKLNFSPKRDSRR